MCAKLVTCEMLIIAFTARGEFATLGGATISRVLSAFMVRSESAPRCGADCMFEKRVCA